MPQSAKAILHQALELPSNDRAALVEGLIASLDKPNPALDAIWRKPILTQNRGVLARNNKEYVKWL